MAGITAIIGKTGSGKSYTAVEFALIKALKEGRHVITNVAIKMDAILEDYPNASIQGFDDERLRDKAYWDGFKRGSVLLLDEIWRIWPAGLKLSDIPEYQLSLFKEQRQRSDENGRSMDVVIVTQILDDISKTIRDQIHTTIICTNLEIVGRPDSYRRDYYEGAVKGFDGVKRKYLKDEFGNYKPEVYKYYKTHMFSDSDGSSPDEQQMINKTFFGSLKAKLLVLLTIILIIIFIIAVMSFGNKSEAKAVNAVQPNKPIQLQNPLVSKVTTAQEVKTQEIEYSEAWRIYGTYQQYTYLTNGDSIRRIKDCEITAFMEMLCVLDGKTVTTYTGELNSSEMASPTGF